MTRFFDLDEANAALPEVRAILESLRDERVELIRLRDQVLLHRSPSDAPASAPTEANVGGASRPAEPVETQDGVAASGPGAGPTDDPAAHDPEVRILRLRMQGVIDRMQAGVARIDELGVTLREIETGLIDFPALATGRQIWLCWRLGEGDIGFWHELGDGFASRQALVDLT
ncbi:MAG TPA: DUF2203 domain-containing protein [Candidatus Limnocylindrales bacterium]|nr:DUF2203 domain-containing protein [Candidatus Limnocylindrales bacterium]